MSTLDENGRHHRADENGLNVSAGVRASKSGQRMSRLERLLHSIFSLKHNHKPPTRQQRQAAAPIHHQTSTPPRPQTAPNASSSALIAAAAASTLDMPHSHEHPLDIVLHDDTAVLRGIGVDIANATIRGFVRLYLQEATDIKTIIIRCTGKSRVALVQKDGSHTQPHTVIHYLKEVDLLEGDKTHPHTIKAGVHEFPFSFELDGSLPASITANFDLAAIEYKLRAIAVRPSFSQNFTMLKDVTVVRSFSPEALEFQQTLEIENSWPEKIQYAVILPHKAWAAGDHISAVLKFVPLAKGVKVVNVRMGLQEKVKTVWRSSVNEELRIVCSKKQKLAHGQLSPRRSPSPSEEPTSANHDAHRRNGTSSFFRRVGSRVQSRENLLGIFRTRTAEDTPPGVPNSPPRRLSSSSESSNGRAASPEGSDGENQDVEIIMRMRIPTDATPSHNVGPVFVSHRIKWNVLISNLDGHHSELRCSLPIHLLAKEVLEETLAATNATRTALLGEDHGVQVEEIILPAYHDHTRDRVAIADLTEHALATNPLTFNAMSTPATPEAALIASLPSSYGASPNIPAPPGSSTVPRAVSMPDASERGRLRTSRAARAATGLPDPHASELYLSLGRRPDTANSQGAESGSHPPSQSSSRASSPDRMGDASGSSRASRHGFLIRPLTSVFKSKASSSASSSNPNSRPSSSQKKHRTTFSRSSSGISAPSSPEAIPPLPLPRSRGSNSPISTQTSAATATTNSTVDYYYDAIPSYAFAAQGFLGGGITPLTSLRGLPSYNEAQRSRASSPQTSTVNSAVSQDSSSSGGSRRRSGTRSSLLPRRSSNEQPTQIPEESQS